MVTRLRPCPIIIIPVHDQATAAGLHALIAFDPECLFLGKAHVLHAGIQWEPIGHAVLAVIENQQFLIGIILPQKILDGQRHKAASVRGGHDARDERLFSYWHPCISRSQYQANLIGPSVAV
jgi:hypothetical protein